MNARFSLASRMVLNNAFRHDNGMPDGRVIKAFFIHFLKEFFMSFTSHFGRSVVAPLALVLATAGGASLVWAQGNAGQTKAPATSPAAVTATQAAQAMNIRQIYDALEAAGYRDIREIEWDDGRYEAKASNAQGQRVKLYINAHTGAVERTRLNH